MTLRFVTNAPHTVVVRSEVPPIYDSQGRMLHPKKERLFAKFLRGIPAPFVQTARERFPKWDRPERPLDQYGGYFDSEAEAAARGWGNTDREEVEAVLLTRPQIFKVEFAKADLPYLAYLKHRKVHGKRTIEHAITDILATLDQTGDPPDKVIAYERDHEDEHSAAIVAAVQAVPKPDGEELVAA